MTVSPSTQGASTRHSTTGWRHWAVPTVAALVLHAPLLMLRLPFPEPASPSRTPMVMRVEPPARTDPPAIRPATEDETRPEPPPEPVPSTGDTANTRATPDTLSEAIITDSIPDTGATSTTRQPPSPSATTLRGRILHSIRETAHAEPSDGGTTTGELATPAPTLPSRPGFLHPLVGRVQPRQHSERIGPDLHQTVTVLPNGQRLCTATELPGMFDTFTPAISTTGLCGRERAPPLDPEDPWLRVR